MLYTVYSNQAITKGTRMQLALIVLGVIGIVGFVLGFATRVWWLCLLPLVVGGLFILSVALSPSDDGDLPPEGQVVLAALFFGIPAVAAAVAIVAGVVVRRWRARSS